jgi:hypothetical protein
LRRLFFLDVLHCCVAKFRAAFLIVRSYIGGGTLAPWCDRSQHVFVSGSQHVFVSGARRC